MAYLEQDTPYPAPISRGYAAPTLGNEFLAAARMLRRRVRIIVLCALLGAVLAGAYAFLATPKYQATVQVALDPRRLQVSDTDEERKQHSDPTVDPARVQSLVEQAKSERVVAAVVDALHLDQDDEFNGDRPGLIGSLLASIRKPEPESPEKRREMLILAVADGLTITPVDNTFMMTLAFLSEDPIKAARIANEFATAYVADQVQANAEVNSHAAEWLKARVTELAAQVAADNAAIVTFKRDNDILTADGKSIAEQSLSDLSPQLTDAIAATAQAKAKLDRIIAVNQSPAAQLTVSDEFNNDVITKMRQQFAENEQRAADLAARYGDDHQAVKRLRADNDSITRSIHAELQRIEQAYESDYDIAKKREDAVRASLQSQFDKTIDIDQKKVKLAELQSTADAAQATYRLYMSKYLQVTQQESFPITEARVTSPASVPTKKFSPKRILLIAIGSFGGTLLGFMIAIGIDLVDRKLRTRRDAEATAGAEFLGYFPAIPGTASPRTSPFQIEGRLPRGRRNARFDYVKRAPFSIAAETIRAVKIAADQSRGGQGARVIGVVSSVPGEGKSTLAANLAFLVAHTGASVLLLDGDLRNPTLSRRLAPDARVGLANLLEGSESLEGVRRKDPSLPLDFVPAPSGAQLAHTNEAIGSARMRSFLDDALANYDYIVVDLPPLLPVVDVRVAAHLIDAFLLVIEWGSTPREVVLDALSSVPAVQAKLLGTVLNKARLARLSRYGEHVQSYYGGKRYFQR
jgi:succinoglycan biosynthesis transport protein ExoP